MAARSHTGALAGSYPVLRAALRQRGISEVARSDELVSVAHALADQPPVPDGLGTAVLTDGGGHGTLVADALGDLGAGMATLSDDTQAKLRTLLGEAAGVTNPIDLAGAADMDPGVFAGVVDVLLQDDKVGGVVIVGLFGGYAIRFDESLAPAELDAARQLVRLGRDRARPLVVHTLYADRDTPPLRLLREGGIPVVGSLEVAARCFRAVHARGQFLSRDKITPIPPAPRRAEPPCLIAAKYERRSTLTEVEARELLTDARVPVSDYVLCRTAAETVAAAEQLGGAVALKVVSPSIAHKTEAGGVELGIRGKKQLESAFNRIMRNATRYAVGLGVASNIRGVLVTPMLSAPLAELIVGVKRDPHFGPVLTVGAGGTAVEVHSDTSLRGLPIGRDEVSQMFREIRVAKILEGYRGKPAADHEALVELVLNVAACALQHPEIEEIEVNPVFAYPDRALAVDARAYLTDTSDAPTRSAREATASSPRALAAP